MKEKTFIFFKYYFPVLLWAGVIFYFSSIPGLRYSSNNVEEVILRKGAHFTEYSILALLIFRIFFRYHNFSFAKATLGAFFVSGLFAVSDEFHQTFVAGRSGEIHDVFYDTLSIALILELMSFFKTKKKIVLRSLLVILTVFLLGALEFFMIKEAGGKASLENSIKEIQNFPETIKKNLGAEEKQKDASQKKESKDNLSKKTLKVENKSQSKKDASVLPDKFQLEVPFTSQAPFFVWDDLHEEACEEASLVMLKYFLDGKKLAPKIAEKEIQGLAKYEIKNYGDYKDTNARQTVQLFGDYYGEISDGKKLRVVYDFSKEELKRYLFQGYPIIVPAAGRLLGNPYFTSPGPLYHNLVLIGYDGNTIITNDPGTKRGESYRYDADVLYEAIHDFPGQVADIEKGRKAMIVVE